MRLRFRHHCGPPTASRCIADRSRAAHGPAQENESKLKSGVCCIGRYCCALFSSLLLLPALAIAQPPWERAASNLERSFTGPLARSLALVAIVVGGLMFMFGEGGAKRQIAGIAFGGGLALFATQFLAWLF